MTTITTAAYTPDNTSHLTPLAPEQVASLQAGQQLDITQAVAKFAQTYFGHTGEDGYKVRFEHTLVTFTLNKQVSTLRLDNHTWQLTTPDGTMKSVTKEHQPLISGEIAETLAKIRQAFGSHALAPAHTSESAHLTAHNTDVIPGSSSHALPHPMGGVPACSLCPLQREIGELTGRNQELEREYAEATRRLLALQEQIRRDAAASRELLDSFK